MRWLLFFPSITFSILKAEIFPWAIIYSFLKVRKIPLSFLFFITLMLCSFVVVTYFYNGEYIGESIRSMGAYLNPFLLFIVLLSVPDKEIFYISRIIPKVLFFLIALGVMQVLGVLWFLDSLFSLLVPRASAEVLSDFRGATLLSSEPSRAAMELSFIYAAWRVISRPRNFILYDFLFAIFMVGVLRSFVGLSYLAVYFFFMYRWKAIVPFSFLLPIFFYFYSDARAVQLLTDVISAESLYESWNILFQQSGFRLVSIIGAYLDGLVSFFGNGVGLWKISSIEAMRLLGVEASDINYFRYRGHDEFIGVRPTSYLANISLDFGMFGIVMVAWIMVPRLVQMWRLGSMVQPIILMFVYSFVVIGAVGNPIPWLCLVVSCRWLEIDQKSHKYQIKYEESSNVSGVFVK